MFYNIFIYTSFSVSETLHVAYKKYIIKRKFCLWPCSLVITSTGRVGLWFCGFMSRSTQRLTSSGSDFKASQKTGQRFKVSSDRLGEAGN